MALTQEYGGERTTPDLKDKAATRAANSSATGKAQSAARQVEDLPAGQRARSRSAHGRRNWQNENMKIER
jgi:hypothetical protein